MLALYVTTGLWNFFAFKQTVSLCLLFICADARIAGNLIQSFKFYSQIWAWSSSSRTAARGFWVFACWKSRSSYQKTLQKIETAVLKKQTSLKPFQEHNVLTFTSLNYVINVIIWSVEACRKRSHLCFHEWINSITSHYITFLKTFLQHTRHPAADDQGHMLTSDPRGESSVREG